MRDHHHERAFLDGAARAAGVDPDEFYGRVQERLAKGEREYHGSFRQRGLRAMVREAAEEGTDAGGWAALGDQLAIDELARDDRLGEARQRLQRMAALGAALDAEGAALLDFLND